MERLFAAAPAVKMLGIVPKSVADGRCTMSMQFRPDFMNVIGTLHAGITAVLADTCIFGAAWSTLSEEETVTTLELKINLLKPVVGGSLEANAELVKRGRTIILGQCLVKDEKGNKVAHAVSTLLVSRDQKRIKRGKNN